MIILTFVEWCNNNQGFIGALLSILTIFISVIALYVSIKLAYIPYKKWLILDPVIHMKDEHYNIQLAIANSGNKIIGIRNISIYYKDTYIGSDHKLKFIQPSHICETFIELNLNVQDTKFDREPRIKIEICDTEKKTYVYEINLALG